jgi:hypothetical protein
MDSESGAAPRTRRRRRAQRAQGAPPAAAQPAASVPAAAAPAAAVPPAPDAPGPSSAKPRRRRQAREAGLERSLRDIVGAGRSQVGVSGALRARDVNRPTDEDLAEAEREIDIVRRNWQPPGPGVG